MRAAGGAPVRCCRAVVLFLAADPGQRGWCGSPEPSLPPLPVHWATEIRTFVPGATSAPAPGFCDATRPGSRQDWTVSWVTVRPAFRRALCAAAGVSSCTLGTDTWPSDTVTLTAVPGRRIVPGARSCAMTVRGAAGSTRVD